MNNSEFFTLTFCVLNALILFFMWMSDKRGKNFEKVEQKITQESRALYDEMSFRFDKTEESFDKIQQHITDIRERLSFVEASSIYTMPIEPPADNLRSHAMKEHWRRRRQKKISTKTETPESQSH